MIESKQNFSDVETLFEEHGLTDYKWIDPKEIVVAQWVRVKCKFGCPNYGRKAACPPNTLSVPECERFFKEYKHAVLFHIQVQFDIPENRFAWYKKMTLKLSRLEQKVFLSGFEKAFFLLFGGCLLCKECKRWSGPCAISRKGPAPRPKPLRSMFTPPSKNWVIRSLSEQNRHNPWIAMFF